MERAQLSDLFLTVIILDEKVMQRKKIGELRFSGASRDRESPVRTFRCETASPAIKSQSEYFVFNEHLNFLSSALDGLCFLWRRSIKWDYRFLTEKRMGRSM